MIGVPSLQQKAEKTCFASSMANLPVSRYRTKPSGFLLDSEKSK
jgi:hypothetical protein